MKHLPTLTALAAAAVLSLAACGGGGGTQATPASHSTNPAPAGVHTALPGEPALLAVPGYDYANPAAGAPSAKGLVKSNPQHVQSASVHMVLHNGTMIGALVLVQLKPQYANQPGVRDSMTANLLQGMAGSGMKVTKETIHTEPVTIGTQGSTVTYCWIHNGVATIVVGDSGQEIRDYVEASLQALHA